MTDTIDEANAHTERTLAEALARHKGTIPEGVKGECEYCDGWSQRLVGGACAPCRDEYKLG